MPYIRLEYKKASDKNIELIEQYKQYHAGRYEVNSIWVSDEIIIVFYNVDHQLKYNSFKNKGVIDFKYDENPGTRILHLSNELYDIHEGRVYQRLKENIR